MVAISFSKNWIHTPPIALEISTDACTGNKSSSGGWGASYKELTCGGAWDTYEQTFHINTRELLAVYYALLSFKKYCENKHVRILCDNMAAVSMISKMGTSKNIKCNEITRSLWSFCEKNNIWVTATYIPGTSNVVADTESRKPYK